MDARGRRPRSEHGVWLEPVADTHRPAWREAVDDHGGGRCRAAGGTRRGRVARRGPVDGVPLHRSRTRRGAVDRREAQGRERPVPAVRRRQLDHGAAGQARRAAHEHGGREARRQDRLRRARHRGAVRHLRLARQDERDPRDRGRAQPLDREPRQRHPRARPHRHARPRDVRGRGAQGDGGGDGQDQGPAAVRKRAVDPLPRRLLGARARGGVGVDRRSDRRTARPRGGGRGGRRQRGRRAAGGGRGQDARGDRGAARADRRRRQGPRRSLGADRSRPDARGVQRLRSRQAGHRPSGDGRIEGPEQREPSLRLRRQRRRAAAREPGPAGRRSRRRHAQLGAGRDVGGHDLREQPDAQRRRPRRARSIA